MKLNHDQTRVHQIACFTYISVKSFIYLRQEKIKPYLRYRGSFGQVPFPVLTKLYVKPIWTTLQKNLKGNIIYYH